MQREKWMQQNNWEKETQERTITKLKRAQIVSRGNGIFCMCMVVIHGNCGQMCGICTHNKSMYRGKKISKYTGKLDKPWNMNHRWHTQHFDMQYLHTNYIYEQLLNCSHHTKCQIFFPVFFGLFLNKVVHK